MENNKQKLFHSFTKNKNGFRYSNSSKKILMKHQNQTKKNQLFPKKFGLSKLLYKNNKLKIQINNKNSNSSGKNRNRNINNNLTDYMSNSIKKTLSLNNTYTGKIKNKLLYNSYNKEYSNLKKALKNKKINYSFINYNINKNKLYKKIIDDNLNSKSLDKNNLFFNSNNTNNYLNNTNYLDLYKNQNNKNKINNILSEPYSFIYKRNKSLFKSNTYSNLEIICEGISNNINNINNHINNINIHCIPNKAKKTEMSPKIKNNYMKIFENKKIKKNKTNSFLLLASINNNNFTNVLNYNITRKKNSNKKKIKIKLNKSHNNKSLIDNTIKYKLNELKVKMEKLFEDNDKKSKRQKYNIIKDNFYESIDIMGLNKDEKQFLKLIMNKYNDVIESYSKENSDLKKTNEKVQNLNLILDKKYLDLEDKYNQNMLLLKEFQKNSNDNDINRNDNYNI